MTVETVNTSHLSRPVRVLIVARVVDRLGGFTMGFLPLLIVASYGASLRAAGLVVAGFGLATIPSRLLGGRLADRLGRRQTIVLGLTGCAAAQTAIAASQGLVVATLAAFALGLCFEIYEPPSQALLADLTEPDQRAAAYAALGAAIAAAGVVAGLLAALLAGTGLRALFLADAATCLACAALVWWALPDVRAEAETSEPRGANPWRDPRLRPMLGVGTAFATVYMVMLGGLPLVLRHDGIPTTWAGVLMAVSAVTVIAGQRWRARVPGDAFDRMRVGYLLLGAGLALAALVAAWQPSGWAYLLPVVVWSAGDVILLGEPFAVVAGLCAAPDRGRYLAAYGISWGVALTLAPLLATTLLDHGGSTTLWLACAAVARVLGLTQSRVRRRVTGR